MNWPRLRQEFLRMAILGVRMYVHPCVSVDLSFSRFRSFCFSFFLSEGSSKPPPILSQSPYNQRNLLESSSNPPAILLGTSPESSSKPQRILIEPVVHPCRILIDSASAPPRILIRQFVTTYPCKRPKTRKHANCPGDSLHVFVFWVFCKGMSSRVVGCGFEDEPGLGR